MAQVDVVSGFNTLTENFIDTNILAPIVDFVQRKGCAISIDDLRNLLKISKVTVAVPTTVAYDPNSGQSTTQTKTTTTPKPRATKTVESGTKEICKHIIKKSAQRAGLICGKNALRWERCKGCLGKACVKEDLVKQGITSIVEIEAVLRDSKKKDGTPVTVPTPSAPQISKPSVPVLTNDQFMAIEGADGFYLHRDSNLIVQKLPNGKYEVKGMNENGSARPINTSDHSFIRKYGFLLNGTELPPEIPASAPAPVPIYLPTADKVAVVPSVPPVPSVSQVPVVSPMTQPALMPVPQPMLSPATQPQVPTSPAMIMSVPQPMQIPIM